MDRRKGDPAADKVGDEKEKGPQMRAPWSKAWFKETDVISHHATYIGSSATAIMISKIDGSGVKKFKVRPDTVPWASAIPHATPRTAPPTPQKEICRSQAPLLYRYRGVAP